MRHALIIAHPKADSFVCSLAETYAKANASLGHETLVRNLYRIGFDPCLKADEIPSPRSSHAAPDVVAERAMLSECDVFAFFYPLWLNTPPAILKGYLERVFGFGFAYGSEGHSYNPLLQGRKMLTFSSSGAPLHWLKQTGAFDSLCVLFDEYFTQLTGITFVDHVHFGGITPGASQIFVQARLAEVEKAVSQHFGRKEHVSDDHPA